MKNLQKIRETFNAGQDTCAKRSERVEKDIQAYNHILHEYADSLSTNDHIAELTLSAEGVIARLRPFPVCFYVPIYGPLPFYTILGDFAQQYTMKMVSMMYGKHTILDIGANLGYYSVIAGTLLPESKVYAFEPIPKTCDELKANVALNNLHNVRVENCALVDKVGESKMFYLPDDPGGASFRNIREVETAQNIPVKQTTLDAYCFGEHVRPDFIKCDVEGSELFVFQGGAKTLQEYHPVLFVEILRKWCRKFGHTANDVVELIRSYGYSMYVIRNTDLIPIESITEETVDTNFVFLPR